MNLWELKYQWQGHGGIIEIKEEGISYLDLAEPRIRLYKNPVEGPSAILVVSKKQLVVVMDNKAREIGPNLVVLNKLRLQATRFDTSFDYKKYLRIVLNVLNSQGRKPVVLGSVALALLFVIMVALFNAPKPSKTQDLEMQLEKMAPDLSAQELVSRRLDLAQRYLADKNYTLVLELSDKILEVQSDHQPAIKIKEEALSLQTTAKTEAKRVLQQELHVQSLLGEVRELSSQGDDEGASLVVEQILVNYPNHVEAKHLEGDIKKKLQVSSDQIALAQKSEQQRLQEAEDFWKQGRDLAGENNLTLAWQKLHLADTMLQDLKIKPSFKISLRDLLVSVTAGLSAQVRPLIASGRMKRNAGDDKTELAQIHAYQSALADYFEAEKIFAAYPLLKDEIDLTVRNLDGALLPYYTEAQTILGLEGCCAAESYFEKVLSLAKFEAVPRYLKAKEILKQCPCK